MPTYEYVCRSCGEHLERVQAFTDDALTTCPTCGGDLRKVFGSVGIVFKGSGFYKTDSRSTSTASTAPGGGAERESSAATASDSGSSSNGDSGKAGSEGKSGSDGKTGSGSPASTPAPSPASTSAAGSSSSGGSSSGSSSPSVATTP